MPITDQTSEPDKEYTTKLTRRQALAFGGAGLTTALSGCSEIFDPSPGDPSNPPPGGNGSEDNSNSDNQSRPSIIVRNDDILNRSEFQLFAERATMEHIRDGGTAEFIVRVYTSPLYSSGRTKLAQKTIEKQSADSTHEITYEIPEDKLNEAQQFIYTVETLSPEQKDEREGYKIGNVMIPFQNQAEGETQMRIDGPPNPSASLWSNELEPLTKVEVWFNEPDESPYNTPDVSEHYPTHWYGEYTDLEITMLVRYPIYEEMEDKDHPAYERLTEGNRDVPLYDWAVFNFDVAEIEMIEARRWNSFVIQQIERGRFDLTDDGKTAVSDRGEYDNHAGPGGLISDGTFYVGDANETPKPFEQYYRSRYGPYQEGGPQSPDNSPINPIHFAAGRPVMKRWAMEMEESLANNSNFQDHEAPEYYKATILKAIIGNAPYAFSIGRYRNTPAELINDWYRNDSTESPLGGNCVAASMFFAGVGVHLLDSTVGLVHLTGDNIAHLQAGLIGVELPSYLPDPVYDDKANGLISENETRYDTQYGQFIPVECNFQGAVIGYEQRVGGEHTITFKNFATNVDINSHIPVNEDYEPDIEGDILADREPPQHAFAFRNTTENPSPNPLFEA